MPKRTHSETVTPATAAAESPKKRGRPCKKLDPLPKDVMKALGILNNYVEKQQAQAQAQAQAEAASDSEVAAISSPEVSEETPPVKRKRGRPKKPKSPSPEVSEEAKPKEDALACSPASSPEVSKEEEALMSSPKALDEVSAEDSPGNDPWVLVPVSNKSYLNPRSLNQDKKVISLVRKYLSETKKAAQICNAVKHGGRKPDLAKLDRMANLNLELVLKLRDNGVFRSGYCNQETWKLLKLSQLTAEQRDRIESV